MSLKSGIRLCSIFVVGGVTVVSVLMVPRVLIFALLSFVCAAGTRIAMIGAPKDKPVTGCRRVITRLIGKFTCRVSLFFLSFVWFSYVDEDLDYSEWLGTGYKKEAPGKRAPVIIANHQSWSVLSSDL